MNFQQLFFSNNHNGNIFRKINAVINVILVIHQLFILSSEAYYLDNNPYRHKQILGPKASFVVEWSVNWKERAILFQVSAETKGWVGFGLSKDGRMVFSDGIIGGVDTFSGKPYFNDIHVTGNRSVKVDDRQDWKLIGAWEKGKRTYLSFTRAMDTCDFQDHPITKDLIALIWAYGENDEIQYHMAHRGSVPVYLLDPVISEEIAHDHYRQIGPHSNLYLVQRFAVINTLRLSPRPTSVWCSVKQGPRLLARHDIVGAGAFLPTKLARLHVQKMFLYKCTSPQQTEAQAFFEPYAKLPGEECYLNEKKTLPLTFCRELIYVWGRGGKPFYFPEDIGIPIGESQTEYYLLETHFDNPTGKSDMDIEAGIEIIYSHRQKANSASLLQIGYGPFGTFMIPPKTQMQIYGSCGPKCTSLMFPKSGANIFAVMLHSHTLGRRIRLQHFRNGVTELPWVLKDDNYDSEFQQMRLLAQQVTILPGDQLTTECTFDSKDRNRTSFSGFSSSDEACSAFVYISTRIPFFRCTSELPAEQLLSRYGVRNFTWDVTWHDRYVTFPKRLEGVWLGDVVDDELQLGKTNKKQLQQDLKYSPHLESCPNTNDMMGRAKNQMFQGFTDNWQHPQIVPVPTKTPYLTSTVSFPRNAVIFREESYCHNEYNNEFDRGNKIPTRYVPQNSDEYSKENSGEYSRQKSAEYSKHNSAEYAQQNNAEYAPQNSAEYYSRENRAEYDPQNSAEYSRENSAEYAAPRNNVEYAPQNEDVPKTRIKTRSRNRVKNRRRNRMKNASRNRFKNAQRNEIEYAEIPENPVPFRDFSIPAIPIPSPPAAPPLQYEDVYKLFVENGVKENLQPPATKNFPIPSQAPINIYKLEDEDERVPYIPSDNRIPVPRQPTYEDSRKPPFPSDNRTPVPRQPTYEDNRKPPFPSNKRIPVPRQPTYEDDRVPSVPSGNRIPVPRQPTYEDDQVPSVPSNNRIPIPRQPTYEDGRKPPFPPNKRIPVPRQPIYDDERIPTIPTNNRIQPPYEDERKLAFLSDNGVSVPRQPSYEDERIPTLSSGKRIPVPRQTSYDDERIRSYLSGKRSSVLRQPSYDDERIPSLSSDNKIPVPRQPPPPPRPSSEFKNRPKPSNNISPNSGALPIPPSPSPSPIPSSQLKTIPKPSKYPIGTGGALPIPPPPPHPPVQSVDFDDFLSDSQREESPQNPPGLRIPVVQGKKPDATTDKSIMNFFEQIASLFSSSNFKDDPENIFSFQQYYPNDSNLLKKRNSEAK